MAFSKLTSITTTPSLVLRCGFFRSRNSILREGAQFSKIGCSRPTTNKYIWTSTLPNTCIHSSKSLLGFRGFYTNNYNLQEKDTVGRMTNQKPGNSPTTPPPPPGNVLDEQSVDSPEQPLSRKAKLKQAVKDYGSTVLVFHITMSLCSLGLVYLLVSSGLDMVGLLAKIGVGEKILQNKITQGASTFVIAYAVHKVFAPVRITITLTATPLIVKKLRTMGILKVPVRK